MKHRTRLGTWLVASFLLAACDAQFVDERSFDPPASDSDASGVPDAQLKEGGSDAGELGDSAAVLASGSWEGRKGYAAEGTVDLVRDQSGNHALQLGETFSVSGVPAPVVVLTSRDMLGTKLESQDLHLGELRTNRGAQRYEIPAGTDVEGLGYAWVFCEPFGIEVARAKLEVGGK